MSNQNSTQTRRDQSNQTFCGFVSVLNLQKVASDRDAKIMVTDPDMDIDGLHGLNYTFSDFSEVDWTSVCLFDFTGRGRDAKMWKVMQMSPDGKSMTEVAKGPFTSCILLIGICRNNYARAYGEAEISRLLGGAFGKVRSFTAGTRKSFSVYISLDNRLEIEGMLARARTIASWISKDRRHQVERSSQEILQSMPAMVRAGGGFVSAVSAA